MTRIKLALMLYFFKGAHKAADKPLLKTEDVAEVSLVLGILLAEDSQVEDLLCGAPSCYEACLFFSDDLLRLWLQSSV